MNQKQFAAARRLEQVLGFSRHYELEGPRAARLIADLDACVRAIGDLDFPTIQGHVARTTRAATGRKLRERLRRGHMLPISRQVKLLFRDEPRLLAAVAVPHATASNAKLVAAARRMAAALRPHRAFLAREGIPRELLAGLTTSATTLRTWHEGASAAMTASTRATRELRQHLAEGGRLKLAIEGIVMGMAVASPRIWDAWVHERRKRKMGRPRKAKR